MFAVSMGTFLAGKFIILVGFMRHVAPTAVLNVLLHVAMPLQLVALEVLAEDVL